MSSNTSGAPCYTCAHGSMCTLREQYLKFYEHRDEVMCRVGYAGSTGNEVDTSDDIQVSVEHRYMNGPGLEDLYVRLGLSAPSYCCLVPQNRCPLHRPGVGSYDRDYFDSPIVNKWNAPLGYISSICEPDKWEPHKYHLPYKRAFVPMNGPCRTCYNATGNKPKNAELLAGTPYSTFAITNVHARTGKMLDTASIEPAENIMSGYIVDTEMTRESYLIEGEDTRIIIYYRYVPKDHTPPSPGMWMDDKTMEEHGLMHKVTILYGNRTAYTYRPFKKDPDFTTIPEREQIKCRILSVRSAHRRLSTRYSTGEFMQMKKIAVTNPSTPNPSEPVKHIEYAVDIKRDTRVYPFIPADTEYVVLNLAKGDILEFEISVPKTHNLFFKMMEYMDCAPELVATHFQANRVDYHLRYVVGDSDKVLHMCLINLEDKMKFGEVRIDYPELNKHGITLSPYHLSIMMDNAHMLPVMTKIAPRAWNNVDEDHMTWNCNLPFNWAIVRNGFELAGYVDTVADAIDFRDDIELKVPSEYEDREFKDVWFASVGDINNREPGYSAYAKWQLDLTSFIDAAQSIFESAVMELTPASVTNVEDYDATVKLVPIISNPEFEMNQLPPLVIKANNISDIKQSVIDIYDAIMDSGVFNAADFQMKLALLPKGTKRVDYHNARNGGRPLAYELTAYYPEEKEETPDEIPPEADTDVEMPDDGFMIPDEMAELDKEGVDITTYMTGDKAVRELTDIGQADVDPFGDIGQGEVDPFGGEDSEDGEEEPDEGGVEDKPTSIPITPLKPATPSMLTMTIDPTQLDGVDVLNALETEDSVAVMLIEPTPDSCFFMSAREFTFILMPLYITLEKAPLEATLIKSVEGRLLDTIFKGLDPIHDAMLNSAVDRYDLLHVEFSEEDEVLLEGELAKYYYIEPLWTCIMADVTIQYAYRGDVIKTEQWRVPAGKMVNLTTDTSSMELFYETIEFLGSHHDEPVLLMWRDGNGKIEYQSAVTAPGSRAPVIKVHTMWSEDTPEEFGIYFVAKHDTHIVVNLMREQLDPNAYCARCAGYVDTSTEEFAPWLRWVPDCLKYEPLH